MIFMSQSGLTDAARESDWDRWYIEHLKIMASVPGISSAQRFKTSSPGHPPSLAMYSVASAEVFQDPYYLSVRGMGEWLTLIDKQHYRRNLFSGLDQAPVPTGSDVLIVADRDTPDDSLARLGCVWLRCSGIDRSTAFRGIAAVPRARADSLGSAEVAVYTPVTPVFKPH
jgi:hypothetical protein